MKELTLSKDHNALVLKLGSSLESVLQNTDACVSMRSLTGLALPGYQEC